MDAVLKFFIVVVHIATCTTNAGTHIAHPVPTAVTNTVFVTAADGAEGFPLAIALTKYNTLVVVGGVANSAGEKAQELRAAGITVLVVSSTQPTSESFNGCDWVNHYITCSEVVKNWVSCFKITHRLCSYCDVSV